MGPRLARFFSRTKDLFYNLVHSHHSSRQIALGSALGVFLGILPTFGLGLIISLGLAQLFGLNRLAALVGVVIMNPLTAPFFWALSALAGGALMPGPTERVLGKMAELPKSWDLFIALIRTGGWRQDMVDVVAIYLAGNLVVGLTFADLFYIVIKNAVDIWRRKNARILPQ